MPPESSGGQAFFPSRQTAYFFLGSAGRIFSTTTSSKRFSKKQQMQWTKKGALYATANLDEGPIIAQDVTRINHRSSVADLIRKGRHLEQMVFADAVQAHLDHRVLVYGRKTVLFE